VIVSLVAGGDGNDAIWAGNGDDLILAGLGNDRIDGGAGVDRLFLSGVVTDYVLTQNSDGSVLLNGIEGTDTVVDVEEFAFADGSILSVEAFL